MMIVQNISQPFLKKYMYVPTYIDSTDVQYNSHQELNRMTNRHSYYQLRWNKIKSGERFNDKMSVNNINDSHSHSFLQTRSYYATYSEYLSLFDSQSGFADYTRMMMSDSCLQKMLNPRQL